MILHAAFPNLISSSSSSVILMIESEDIFSFFALKLAANRFMFMFMLFDRIDRSREIERLSGALCLF
jgi:hypothetical protein